MFVMRTFCIEASFFSSYKVNTHKLAQHGRQSIDPLIPEEYRLVIYLFPCLVSFLINIIKLSLSTKPKDFRYFKKFPQFLLCPMFCPLMFEGNLHHCGDDQPPVRVWKLGSILNSFFIGCAPQFVLLAFDRYRKVPDWYFEDLRFETNALLQHPYGNTIFSIATLWLYISLTTIFFAWDKLFKDEGLLCTLCRAICPPFSNTCTSSKSEESDPSTVSRKEIPEKDVERSIKIQSPSGGDNSRKQENRENLEESDLSVAIDKAKPGQHHEQSIRDSSFAEKIQVTEGEEMELEVSDFKSIFLYAYDI